MWGKKKEIQEVHEYMKNSFQGVRQDNEKIYQWIQHLHQTNQQQEQLLGQLYQKNQHQEWRLQQLQQPVDHSHQINHLHQKINELNQKVDQVLDNHQHHSNQFHHHSQKLDDFHQRLQNLEKPKRTFKEKIVQSFSKNSKNYLKNLIFQYLEQHEKISALQLKDMVVDQQGLASKSTFYRILQEIEDSPQVTVIKDGKQKYFILERTIRQ